MYKQLRRNVLRFLYDIQKIPFLFFLIFSTGLCFFSLPIQGKIPPKENPIVFSPLAEGGFWKDGEYDGHNTRAYSMAWFKGKIYVGTGRDILTLRYWSDRGQPPLEPYPAILDANEDGEYTIDDIFWVDKDSDGEYDKGEGLDTRAQIWRYTPPENPEGEKWEKIYTSPWIDTIQSDSKIAREYGYRSMVVFTEPGGTEALYIGTTIPYGDYPLILRSVDGVTFERIESWPPADLPPGQTTTIRALVPFKGKLYMATNNLGTQDPDYALVYEGGYEDGSEGPPDFWRPVSLPGFLGIDNPENTNYQIYEMCEFNGYLYAGTLNPNGFQIWRTDGETIDPDNPNLYFWERIVTDGAYRGSFNETVTSMSAFTDPDGESHLYVGGAIESAGYDPVFEIGPGTAEVIRINTDGSFDLIFGEERENPETGEIISPISGMGPGFDNPFAGYIWRIEKHDNWLYIATMDNSILASYVPIELLKSEEFRQVLEENPELMDYILEQTGGFDIWKTQYGYDLYPVNVTGFGNIFNLGVRCLVSTPIGLALGTSNPFTAIPAPESGAQVWLGNPGEIAAPTNLQSNPEENRIKLRWTPSEGAVRYRIIRFTEQKMGDVTVSIPPPEPIGMTTEHFFIDTTVVPGERYMYTVKADTDRGVSNVSNVVGAVGKDMFIFTASKPTFNRVERQFVQKLTITNHMLLLREPVPIVLEGLTPHVMLANQDSIAENGSPVIYAPQIPKEQSVTIVLKFNNPTFAPIKYVPFVVWGSRVP